MLVNVFPGQGSQYQGMGEELFDSVPVFRMLEEELDDIAGFSIREMCLKGAPEKLQQTEITQPCLFIVNALYWEQQKAEGKRPAMLAGHSLGEYNALLAANTFDLQTGLYLVRERGRLMSEAKEGGMAAVVGLPVEKISEVLSAEQYHCLDIANYNTTSQIVISGPKDVIFSAEKHMIDAGASLFFPLQVGAAFHSRYMASAADEFADVLADVNLRAPKLPVYSNVTASPYAANASSSEIAELLAKQIRSPVRWFECVQRMAQEGECDFRELGPGKTLTGMLAHIPLLPKAPAKKLDAHG